MTLLLTILFGWLGYYRFHKKQYGMGILYLITGGLFCIGWFYDIFKAATEKDTKSNGNNVNVPQATEQKAVHECSIFDPFVTSKHSFYITDTAIFVDGEQVNFADCDKIHIVSGCVAIVGKGGDAEFSANGKDYTIYFNFEDNARFCRAIEFANKKIFALSNEPAPKYYFIAFTGSELAVYDDYITLSHVRTTSGITDYVFKRLEGGNNGLKRVKITDITSIQHKEPTKNIVGFVQFAYPGSIESRGGAATAINDENAIPYYIERVSEMREIVDYIENAREKGRNKPFEPVVINQGVSAADELKKYKDLLDAGVITQEEFDAKKKQLMGM